MTEGGADPTRASRDGPRSRLRGRTAAVRRRELERADDRVEPDHVGLAVAAVGHPRAGGSPPE